MDAGDDEHGTGGAHVRSRLRDLVRRGAAVVARSAPAKLHATWSDAAREGAYDAEVLTRFRFERARLNAASVTAADLPPGFALLFAAVHLGTGHVRVTDFGGACGEWAVALRRDVRRTLEYTVVENGALVDACAREPAFGWARFARDEPPGCDVFLSSGTLQYLDDPYALVDRAFSTAKGAVVLARNSFADQELFRVHRSRLGDNGFGSRLPEGFDLDLEVRYPHRTISLERVLAAGAAHGWRCALSLESPSGVLPYRRAVFGRDLLFLRS